MRAAAVTGVRTRSRAAAEAAAGPPAKRRKRKGVELKELRKGRRICVAAAARRRPGSPPANSSCSERGGRISRCSSNASCDAMEKEAELRSGSVKDTAVCYLECSRESRRRETTPSTSIGDQSGDLESTAATRSGTAVAAMPAPSEIEEFFAAAESTEKRRFTDKYNFDVDRDIPLDGRYEWVRLEA